MNGAKFVVRRKQASLAHPMTFLLDQHRNRDAHDSDLEVYSEAKAYCAAWHGASSEERAASTRRAYRSFRRPPMPRVR